MKKETKIIIHNLNEEKPNTCGSCKHTDNDLGIVALHCDLIYDSQGAYCEFEDGKVRSWNECSFKPSMYTMYTMYRKRKK
jgi:hypothetical protein